MSEEADKKAPSLSTDLTVAVMLLAIDQELAARVMRYLNDDQVERVTRAMKELQELSVSHNTICDVLSKTVRRMRQGGLALGDVLGQPSFSGKLITFTNGSLTAQQKINWQSGGADPLNLTASQ